jgi:hypothetical protein
LSCEAQAHWHAEPVPRHVHTRPPSGPAGRLESGPGQMQLKPAPW